MATVVERIPASRRVGLNAHLLSLAQSYRGAGINGYILGLLAELPGAAPDLELVAYLHDPRYAAPARLQVQRSRWDTSRPSMRIPWEQTRLACETRHLDLLHCPAFAAPLRSACPTVVTIHDLSFLRFPGAHPRWQRYYLSTVTRLSCRRAAHVIAVSEATRQDVISLLGVTPARVTTVPNGITGDYCPGEPAAVEEFRRRRGLPDRFILFVGTLEPRKNIVRLVEAYAEWRSQALHPVKLVIAGGHGWFYDRIFARVAELGIGDDVLFPGFVPGAELPWWYRAATLFVYPSLFEGFGLPVLEAMACGTPTITSTLSALPEVAGQAAILVYPEDTTALATAIDRVLSDPSLAHEMSEAGLQRAATYSWKRTAAETVEVYRGVLRGA